MSVVKIISMTRQHMVEVVELLQSLSSFHPSIGEYDLIWSLCKEQPNVHRVVGLLEREIIGYGSIFIETKIRGGNAGHIEDIVIKQKFRNKGVGKSIVDSLHKICIDSGCYKISLQCREHNVGFYKECGFETSGYAMQRFL